MGRCNCRTGVNVIDSQHFEQHVAAYWLAQLLVRGIPPVLIDTVVTEVSFQTQGLGWHTDDFLVVCERPGSPPQRLAGQVKRQFVVSAANDECVGAIRDFWQDYNGRYDMPRSFIDARVDNSTRR